MSRRHVEIEHVDTGYAVRDVGSLNGTYLNQERIEDGPIHNGDELQVGKFKLVFLVGRTPARLTDPEHRYAASGATSRSARCSALLQDEFPDVTISKIRFLESQGLIDPERTPSGYRKFYEADVDRLRCILREQKEHFLPLKVIKDRLDSGETIDDAHDADGAARHRSRTDGTADAAPTSRRRRARRGTRRRRAPATAPEPPRGAAADLDDQAAARARPPEPRRRRARPAPRHQPHVRGAGRRPAGSPPSSCARSRATAS